MPILPSTNINMTLIRNIVAIGKLSGNFCYEKIDISNRFSGVKTLLDRSTCLLFPNGAITIVGIKNMEDFIKLPEELSRRFPQTSLIPQEDGSLLRICNIVATTGWTRPFSMNKLYDFCRPTFHITYTPETFPGMKIELRQKLVVIVFHTGKIVITGARSVDDVNFAEMIILNILRNILDSK